MPSDRRRNDKSALPRAVGALLLGVYIASLSWLLWRLTGSFIGWAVLWTPGAAFICAGLYWLWRDW